MASFGKKSRGLTPESNTSADINPDAVENTSHRKATDAVTYGQQHFYHKKQIKN